MEIKELYNKILSIAQDVSCIRDMCNCTNEDNKTHININPIHRRSTEATNKLFALLDELEAKIKNNEKEML